MPHQEEQRQRATLNNDKQANKRGRTEVDDEDQSTAMHPEMKEMLLSLSAKMDSLQEAMSGIDIRLNNKIDNLEGIMSGRINDVKSELENRIATASSNAEQRIANARAEINRECERNVTSAIHTVHEHVDEIRSHHEGRLDRLERF